MGFKRGFKRGLANTTKKFPSYARTLGKLAANYSAIMRAVRITQNQLNPEKNMYTLGNQSINLGVTGSVEPLVSIAQGDNAGQRQGLSVKLNGLYIRYHIRMDGSATTNNCRVMVVMDTSTQGYAPPGS